MDVVIYENESYFDWLYRLGFEKCTNFRNLASILHGIVYFPVNAKDEDRVLDGLELRKCYESATKRPANAFYDPILTRQMSCSMLELIIGLANCIDQNVMWDSDKGNRTTDWVYRMLRNIGLDGCTDDYSIEEMEEYVKKKCQIFVSRTYSFDGSGGLFPLLHPVEDQRKLPLWYQMQNYLMENFPI